MDLGGGGVTRPVLTRSQSLRTAQAASAEPSPIRAARSSRSGAVTLTNTDCGARYPQTNNKLSRFLHRNIAATWRIQRQDKLYFPKAKVVTGIVLHVADDPAPHRTLTAGPRGRDYLSPGRPGPARTCRCYFRRPDQQHADRSAAADDAQLRDPDQPAAGVSPSAERAHQLNRGPSSPTGGSSTVAFSINGRPHLLDNWTIDGSDNLDRGANLTLYTYPSPDAISQFKTLRGQYSCCSLAATLQDRSMSLPSPHELHSWQRL